MDAIEYEALIARWAEPFRKHKTPDEWDKCGEDACGCCMCTDTELVAMALSRALTTMEALESMLKKASFEVEIFQMIRNKEWRFEK